MANVEDDVQNERFAQEMRKFLFYSKSFTNLDGEIEENDSLRTPVGVFAFTSDPDRHFAVTWNHGAHENIKQESALNIYNQDGDKFETKVLFKDPIRDFLLLESDEELARDAPYVVPNIIGGTHYLIMGYRNGVEKALPADALLEPSFLPGIVTADEFDKNGCFGGTSAEMPGFFGGPAYQKLCRKEFLGLCVKGAQGYQIVAGRSLKVALIYLEQYEKRILKEENEKRILKEEYEKRVLKEEYEKRVLKEEYEKRVLKEEYEKRVLKETEETKKAKKSECSIL